MVIRLVTMVVGGRLYATERDRRSVRTACKVLDAEVTAFGLMARCQLAAAIVAKSGDANASGGAIMSRRAAVQSAGCIETAD